MRRFAVIDTNVVVSGLLSGAADSPTRRVLDAILAGTIPLVLSESLLAEYREVLLRPAIAERHGLTEAEIDIVLEEVVVNAALREPRSAEPPMAMAETGPAGASVAAGRAAAAPHGDEHLIALLTAVPEAVLVTGDHRLAEAVASWCTVATPAEFAATLVDQTA
ncbi:MAG: PIN domain-containing protein [Actinomycetia bacterium]|nr:PIN domain-containing protein [Actinomycetes bacterium]